MLGLVPLAAQLEQAPRHIDTLEAQRPFGWLPQPETTKQVFEVNTADPQC